MEDIIDFHGTELFRGDAEALKEIYKAIRKEYTTGRVGINEKRISYLGLGVYNLTEIPDIIGELSRLLRLDLEHNHLAQLPDTLENLPTLKALYAGSNPLDGKAKEMLERMKARGVNVVY